MIWPNVLCRRCCAFPGEPCRTGDSGAAASRPHADRLKDADLHVVELAEQNVTDLHEWRRRRAS